MDAFCPHCKAKYDVDLEDDGCVTECEVCHKEFTVKVENGKAQAKTPNSNSDEKKARVKVKGFTFDTTKLGSDYERPRDINFAGTKSAAKFIFFFSVVLCVIVAVLGLSGGVVTAIVSVLFAVIYFLINYIVYNMFLMQTEIVRHLREIRDKK